MASNPASGGHSSPPLDGVAGAGGSHAPGPGRAEDPARPGTAVYGRGSPPTSRWAALSLRLIRSPALAPAIVAVLVYLFFLIESWGSGFASTAGTASWLDTTSELGIVAIPVALLMVAGEFDLSVGSVVGAGSITVGICLAYYHLPLVAATLIGLAVGIIVGLLNGFLVTRTGLPSFIVTLGANLAVLGAGITISSSLLQATTVTVNVSDSFAKIFDGQLDNFNVSILWFAASASAAGWILKHSRYGSWILATGGDEAKARRSGVLTTRIKVGLFVWTALAAAFLGILQAVEYNTGDPTTGASYVFEAPIVAVIGGTLLTGGYGTVTGVVFGLLIYGVTDAGLFYTGWNTNLTQVFLGLLMIIAVLANRYLLRLALLPGTRARRERR